MSLAQNLKLSIITVAYNASQELELTLQSVNSQLRRYEAEHIVIDGGSTDDTAKILHTYVSEIDTAISEPDKGVYDAMNKGLALAKSDWIYFLNAGDVFYNEHSLSQILEFIGEGDVLYSDVIVDNAKSTYSFLTNFEDKALNHQGFVYKKALHERFGLYAVIKGFTAADYLFFLQLDGVSAKKLEHPIAIFKAGGLSSTVNAVHQKYCLDFLSGRVSTFYLASILLGYPFYRMFKNWHSKFFK